MKLRKNFWHKKNRDFAATIISMGLIGLVLAAFNHQGTFELVGLLLISGICLLLGGYILYHYLRLRRNRMRRQARKIQTAKNRAAKLEASKTSSVV